MLFQSILCPRLHCTTPPLVIAARSVAISCDSAVILHANTDSRHEPFCCLFRLFFDVLPHDLVTLLKDESDERHTNKQCQSKQDNVYRNRVVLEDLVRRGVESGLREIEDTS